MFNTPVYQENRRKYALVNNKKLPKGSFLLLYVLTTYF